MNRTLRKWLVLSMAAALSLPVGVIRAADTGAKDKNAISSNDVARLTIEKGTTWVRMGDTGEWEEATGNFPVTVKSRVSVPEGSSARIQFHGGQVLSLKGGSEVDIREMGDKGVSYRLRSGDADLSLAKEDFVPVRIDVPGNREVRADSPGRYSLSTAEGLTKLDVRSGEGIVAGGKGSPVTVKAGEMASIGEEVRVSRAGAEAPLPPPEEPTLTEAEQKAGLPSSGAVELREYGDWVWTSEYGYVWRPYVDDSWEPYDYGRWVWNDLYGWVWVPYEPWGWWPYHYGWWWPSPVFGWVWCPFNSFVSVDFFFGGHLFFGHRAAFFPGNVFFVGRGGFVRWVPPRPGVIANRTVPFARGDARLAGWNRPVDRGAVMMRGPGGSHVAWTGHDGSFRSTGIRGDRGLSRTNLRGSAPSVSRSPRSGAVRGREAGPRSGIGSAPRGGSRQSPVYRGGGSGRSGGPRGSMRSSPMRSQPERAPSFENRGGSRGGGGRPEGFSGGGFRGGGGGQQGFSGGGFRGGDGGRRTR